jgi:uncharacterized protein (TIGR02646 family)
VKRVSKGTQPKEYRDWRRKVKGTAKEDYRELPSSVKGSLLEALITQQGYLCAYTMKRIYLGTSHVEHIKPEAICRAYRPGADLDYINLVACFPRVGMREPYRYGAQKKDNWWKDEGANFVSPLDPNCEKRFRFDLDGNITAVNGNGPAKNTIVILALDHGSLSEDRRKVIYEFVYGKNGNDPLSFPKTKQASASICRANEEGEFNEFCVAIRDGLNEHLGNLTRLSKKRKFVRKK